MAGLNAAIRVLLIEDNHDHADLLRAMLTMYGPGRFRLCHQADLERGLEHVTREEVDIVLLDLGLPGCSDLDALERVHQMVPATPIVVLTAFADEAAAARALHNGAQDYLLKGMVDGTQLVRAIRYAIERNRVLWALDAATHQLRTANARLEKVALLDPLTEVLNRRGLEQVLFREIRWARRNGSETAAVLLDLDDFKQINDTLGLAVGDVVLKAVAHKLLAGVRGTDYVARIGGDEFLVLLPQTGPERAAQIAEKLRLAVSQAPVSLASEAVKVGASLGVVAVSDRTQCIDELLSQSHFVLSQSKRAGKNRVSFERTATPQSLWEVISALSRGEAFRVVRQPIVRLEDEREVGYEFLSRFSCDEFAAPNDFFRLCLENNILTTVDYRCLRNCLAAAACLDSGMSRHVNLFPSTLLNLSVHQLLEAFPAARSPGSYCVEISEQQIIGDPQTLAGPVSAFKREGILIAFDDVGFGHSCLESLTFLEPDVIKIDKTCVIGIAHDASRLRCLKRLVRLSKALGAEVVAEGVQCREDLEVLKYLGVEYGQGFLWAPPA